MIGGTVGAAFNRALYEAVIENRSNIVDHLINKITYHEDFSQRSLSFAQRERYTGVVQILQRALGQVRAKSAKK